MYFIQMITGEDDIVLDSFAGPGTTAHAILNMNKVDCGHRKFILVEMMQNPILDCILIHCIQTYFCDHVSIFLRIEDFAARIRRHDPNRTAAAI